MSLTLIGYQSAAATETIRKFRRSCEAFTDGDGRTGISLSAPTGSGKTIMAAAIIERLMFGTDGLPPNPNLVVLWVSDNVSLNNQTRDKFMRFSDRFTIDRLPIIGDDDPLNAPHMTPGKVYFLNTQKLGGNASSFQRGDGRDYSLWDAIDGTGKKFGTDFLMVVDEAHRGTGRAGAGGRGTILARLVRGGEGLTDPAPVVLGISATPQRFEALVERPMTVQYVKVDVDLVRESGLVKDKVTLAHPRETQASDATLLAMAAHKRQEMAAAWQTYTEAEGLAPVDPALLLQVNTGDRDDQIGRVLDALFDADRSLRDDQVVHTLETHKPGTFGRHTVRWIEPSRIHETPGVKVVLFKEALTTGWDCPRAEVLISLRKAEDATYITQLIGRTVRTPLARRIETVDALNSVWCYLPRFNETTVDQIVGLLGSGDDAITAEVEANPVLLEPNPEVDADVWDALAHFPTNTRPSKTARSDVDRAITLGMILAGHGVRGVGKRAVEQQVIGHLTTLMNRDDVAEFVDSAVKDYESIEYATLSVDWMTGAVVERAEGSTVVSAANVVDLFNSAKRRLPGASATWLWNHLCDTRFPDDAERARLYVAAVAFHPEAVQVVESAAKGLFDGWRRQHRAVLISDPDAQAQVTRLQAQSRASEPTVMQRPDRYSVSPVDDAHHWWPKHLLASRPAQQVSPESVAMFPERRYPMTPGSSWEEAVLTAELARPDVVAWYRNPTGGAQAIAVPYGDIGAQAMVYPDFVVFRRVNGQIVVDIVDPHDPSRDDTAPKWSALSMWSRQVNDGTFDLDDTLDGLGRRPRLGRVWAVIADRSGNLLHVDLLEDGIGDRLTSIASAGAQEAAVRGLFDERGSLI